MASSSSSCDLDDMVRHADRMGSYAEMLGVKLFKWRRAYKLASQYYELSESKSMQCAAVLGYALYYRRGVRKRSESDKREDESHRLEQRKRAIELLSLAADSANVLLARSVLGAALVQGKHVAKDVDKGLAMLKQAALIERHPVALNNYGLLFESDESSDEHDDDENDDESDDDDGEIRSSRKLPEPRDLNRALELYRLAASQGHAVALYNVGRLLEHDELIESDVGSRAAALEHYVQAADKGHSGAMCMAGWIYSHGTDGDQLVDTSKAMLYYRMSADCGDAWALGALARLYESVDDAEAVRLYRRGVVLDDADCVHRLGRLVELGLAGAKADVVEALRLYTRAVELMPHFKYVARSRQRLLAIVAAYNAERLRPLLDQCLAVVERNAMSDERALIPDVTLAMLAQRQRDFDEQREPNESDDDEETDNSYELEEID
jgi:TPR repeat protein